MRVQDRAARAGVAIQEADNSRHTHTKYIIVPLPCGAQVQRTNTFSLEKGMYDRILSTMMMKAVFIC